MILKMKWLVFMAIATFGETKVPNIMCRCFAAGGAGAFHKIDGVMLKGYHVNMLKKNISQEFTGWTLMDLNGHLTEVLQFRKGCFILDGIFKNSLTNYFNTL